MWYNFPEMIYGWYSAGYSLMELVASPDSPAMVTGDISGRNSVLVHIDGVDTEEEAGAITSITWSVRSPTGALMDYPLDPDIVFQSLPPLPAGRRLRFFEEGKEYLFFRFQIPQEMLTEPGAGAITPRFKVGEDFKAGTLLTYAVFKGNANDEDSLITKSQYDYLLAYVDRGITEAEGDERWVRLDPDGDTASQRLQPILGDIRITSTRSSIPQSYLQLVSWGGSPSIAGKRNGEAYATSLRFFPAEGHLSANAILNTPDEGGTLATREWVNEHAQPEDPPYETSFTADQLFIINAMGKRGQAEIQDTSLYSFLNEGKGKVRLSVSVPDFGNLIFILAPDFGLGSGSVSYPIWTAEATLPISLLEYGGGEVNTFFVTLEANAGDGRCELGISVTSIDRFCGRYMTIQDMDYRCTIAPSEIGTTGAGVFLLPVDDNNVEGGEVTLATREWVNSNINISWEDYPD